MEKRYFTKMNYRQQTDYNNRYFSEQAAWLVDTFQNSNVIVFGKKGSGKSDEAKRQLADKVADVLKKQYRREK